MARKITSLDQVTEFPLCWPDGKPRAAERISSPFTTSMAKAQSEIGYELPRWGAMDWTVSMAPQHRQGAVDPGVAVWFEIYQPGAPSSAPPELRVIACDTYPDRKDNLHAIALTLERLRSLERYGTYSAWQALEGARAALPPPSKPAGPPWWEVLAVDREWPLGAIKLAYQQRAREAHPDNGGLPEAMARINAAWEEAKREKAE